MSIRALIVDDEPLARRGIRQLLEAYDDVHVVGECRNGREALAAFDTLVPDLVFLDVQMPELDGLGVIDTVGADRMPLTVFVTAYDQHAIRAFEANALDYLQKPFSDERLEATMARVKGRLDERSAREFGQRILRMISTTPTTNRRIDRLVVKSGGTTRFIRVVDIDWIEAAGVYVNLHVAGKELLYRASLNELVDKLDPMRFIRVHRSVIVNIESILQLEPISHGEFEVVLKDNSRARVSRTYRAQLEKRLGQSL